MKQRKREEIEEQYKWDLTPIFKSVEDWQKEYDEVYEIIPNYLDFKGKITSSKETFKKFFEFDEKLERRIYKLYYYAHLNFDLDTTNNEYQVLSGKMDNLFKLYGESSTFIIPELLSADYNIILEYLNSDEDLKKYRHNLENIFRSKEHELTEEQKQVLASLGNVLSSPQEIYESLTDSDLKFGTILDENDNEVEFTESNWSLYCRSKNRRVREDAFNMLYGTYSKYVNTIANTFSKNVDLLTSSAKLHKFNSSIEASLFDDAIDVSVYNNLIDTINKRLSSNHDYYKLKKDVLNIDELHLYDVYASLVDNYEKKYTFEEGKELVLRALSPLGGDYIEILEKAFNERWIDVYNNVGKRGGAYSSGFYDTNPYVLLNFEGNFEDVSTLAHELGHSCHTYYSCKNNEYCNSSYQIFVAEVASTVNELLLRLYMINNTNDIDEKLYLINSILESFRTTVFRQTMFAEFERDMHKYHEDGEVLTNEFLSQKYYDLNKKYFGENVVIDENIKYEWMRVPHFYYNFYVYKYAIGLSCAAYIATNIYNKTEGFLEKYKSFLKSGGSMYPAEELKLTGIDVTSEDIINSGIDMFDDMLKLFKELEGEKNGNR